MSKGNTGQGQRLIIAGGVRMIWPDDFINKIICGDCLEVMKQIPDESIQMCLTSPPYWGLRDYGIKQIWGGDKDCEHKWGDDLIQKQLGAAAGLSAQVGNQKKKIQGTHIDQGNFCLKCNAWKGQLGLEPTHELYIEHMTQVFHEVKRVLKKDGTLWLNLGDTYGGSGKGYGDKKPDPKIKGRDRTIKPDKNNPPKCLCMIPERMAWSLIQDGWILRNKIIWYKPNGMPSSVKDRFSNKWEYVFLFSKSKKYYFDLDSILEPYTEPMNRWGGDNLVAKGQSDWDSGTGQETYRNRNMRPNPNGKNPGDHWTIPTSPFPEAHFAVFPEKLCERPIKAGSKEGDIVLDPFSGSGTTCKEASYMRRQYIGIDINQDYCDIAATKRLAQGVL